MMNQFGNAQNVEPAHADLFGDAIVRKISSQRPEAANPEPSATPSILRGYRHLLIFQNGCRLGGELMSMGADEIVWRREGLGDALRFRRSEVGRIIMADEIDSPPPGQASGAPLPLHATVKLPGGDWLYGDVESEDGMNYSVKLGNEMRVALPADGIEWLYFGEHAIPLVCVSSAIQNLTAGADETLDSDLSLENGEVVAGAWLARETPIIPRVEIEVALSGDAEEGTMMALSRTPASVVTGNGRGTVKLTLMKDALRYFADLQPPERGTAPIPEGTSRAGKIAVYRIYLDWTKNHGVVFRDDRQLAAFSLLTDAQRNDNPIYLCMTRESPEKHLDVRFTDLQIKPWDGRLPTEGDSKPEECHLSAGAAASITGRVEALSGPKLMFSGTERQIVRDTLLEFPATGLLAPKSDAALFLGASGNVSASDLLVANGESHCRTAFSPKFSLPLGAIQQIIFPRTASAPADVLVLPNGDEIGGRLVSATKQSLRWEISPDQEVEIPTSGVAGVRFGGTAPVKPNESASAFNLKNGDTIYAELVEFSEKTIRIKHSLLGTVDFDRAAVLKLYPESSLIELDGARDASVLLKGSAESQNSRQTMPLTDGLLGDVFIPSAAVDSIDLVGGRSGLAATEQPAFFELRFDITNPNGDWPDFSLTLDSGGEINETSVFFQGGEIGVVLINGRSPATTHNVSLIGKLPEFFSRMHFVAMVDRASGAIDLEVNGVTVGKFRRADSERARGLGGGMSLYPGRNILSHVWLGPASEALQVGDGKTRLLLSNGDLIPGTIRALRDGRLLVDTDAGTLEPAWKSVQSIVFDTPVTPKPPAARIFLPDGSTLNVDDFHYQRGELSAQSELLGTLRFPANVPRELAFHPASPGVFRAGHGGTSTR